MMSSTVGIKVRLKLRIIIRIALLSIYMFFDFGTTPEEVSLQNQRTHPTVLQTSSLQFGKASYTDGEHGDCKLLWMRAFVFCTVTLTIASLMRDWESPLTKPVTWTQSHNVAEFDFLLTPTLWYMKSLFTAI